MYPIIEHKIMCSCSSSSDMLHEGNTMAYVPDVSHYNIILFNPIVVYPFVPFKHFRVRLYAYLYDIIIITIMIVSNAGKISPLWDFHGSWISWRWSPSSVLTWDNATYNNIINHCMPSQNPIPAHQLTNILYTWILNNIQRN